MSAPSDAELRQAMAANRDAADEALRAELVRRAQIILDRRSFLEVEGYNAVVIVTDPNGAFVGVASTTGDDYTRALLVSALQGADFQHHTARPTESPERRRLRAEMAASTKRAQAAELEGLSWAQKAPIRERALEIKREWEELLERERTNA